jgi:hypothetical protein
VGISGIRRNAIHQDIIEEDDIDLPLLGPSMLIELMVEREISSDLVRFPSGRQDHDEKVGDSKLRG